MTPEQFWEQDCDLVKYFRKAAQIKQDLRNQDSWLQGLYVYEALVDVAPIFHAFAKKGTKATPYRKEPYDLNMRQDKEKQEKVEQKSDDRAKVFMEAFAMAYNQKFQKKGGGVNG